MQLQPVATDAAARRVQTLFSERNGEASPDGWWLAYEVGRFGATWDLRSAISGTSLAVIWQVLN